jgi:hypothetical protein
LARIAPTGCTGSANNPIVVTGTGYFGGQYITGQLQLNYSVGAAPQQPDFTFTASPTAKTLTASGSDVYMLNIVGTNGFTGSVNLSAGFLDSGASGIQTSFVMGSTAAAGSVPPLKVIAPPNTPANPHGSPYTLVVTAIATINGVNITHSYNLSLTVNAVTTDFAPSGFTSPALLPGMSVTVPVSAQPIISGTVPSNATFAITRLPRGLTATFASQGVVPAGSTTLSLTFTAAANGFDNSDPVCYQMAFQGPGSPGIHDECDPPPPDPGGPGGSVPPWTVYPSGPTQVQVPNNGEPVTYGP